MKIVLSDKAKNNLWKQIGSQKYDYQQKGMQANGHGGNGSFCRVGEVMVKPARKDVGKKLTEEINKTATMNGTLFESRCLDTILFNGFSPVPAKICLYL